MTNGEKFKTADERIKHFSEFCATRKCDICKCTGKGASILKCAFDWLDLEYREELKNCPFCVGEAILYKRECSFVKCHDCDAESFHGELSDEVVAAWNRRV
jgi:hypothetical protein